ncbi:MAG: type II secretion system F family protein [Lachnospiraceae bacterium]|nr:type II secretion system F family protein [Lachnospiraceae bacterium]MDY3222978.1 type II secretion system F family protein [Lachnospiraceae bacterium]
MPDYSYTAIDKSGIEVKGSISADSREKVFRKIKGMGMIPIDIAEQSFWNKEIKLNMDRKPSPRELSVFCRQFVSMTRAGVTIIETMRMLADQTENRSLKKAVEEVRASLEKGEGLAASMREHPREFPSLLVSMVAAGEASGSLDTAMERMSIQLEKAAKNQGMIKKAMIYPAVIFFVAVAVIGIMLTVVIPSFSGMFEELGSELPAITQAVVALSDLVKANWMVLLLTVSILVIALKAWAATDSGSYIFAELQFRIPVVKNLVIRSASARMARTLGTLISAGIPLVESVEVVAKTMDNVLIRDVLLEAKEEMMMGVPLSVPLQASDIFPSMVIHMIKVGEEAGTTEEMLTKLADYYDEEVELAVQSLMAAMEPLIIVVLAGVVFILVASVIFPMANLYTTLDKL